MEAAASRQYPLREKVKEAWAKVGVSYKRDMNDGNPLGLGELIENRVNCVRHIASSAYGLKNVEIVTETLVRRVVVTDKDSLKVATAVELTGGHEDTGHRIIKARREVIISAGTYRSPQILMLSGLGPQEELKKHGIQTGLICLTLDAIFTTIAPSTNGGSLRSPKRDSQSDRLLSTIRFTSKETHWTL